MTNDELRKELLARLRGVEKIVRADLLAQYRSDPVLLARALQCLRDEEGELAGKDAWLETFAGRAAVLYILKTLYIRVLEDQRLLITTRLRDGGTYQLFRTLFPQLGYAAYLRLVFIEAERALPELFAATSVEIAEPGEASANALWAVWQQAAPGGGPFFDFRGELDTRFIGDLYQDLDPDVKARYALLQTPRFIEEFILDRTMTPALAEFGLDEFRIIDPTCGSGHFLLGAFERLFAAWGERLGHGPEARWTSAKRALASVYGADLNEYASALSRFRLLLALVHATSVTDFVRLRTVHLNVLTCDSLIPWERIAREMLPGTADVSWLARYGSDAERTANETFFSRGFHAVVGNPPYIAVKDKKKREDYRRAWPRSAAGKYSLSAPMTERFLLMPLPRGRSGLIVANNFCKREFGKSLVEKALRDVELDLVVDSSGAYIPGHGTPTVMLFTTRQPVDLTKHGTIVVAGKRGEPREPPDPAHSMVWSSIAAHWDAESYEDSWIAVSRAAQLTLTKHPWSFGSDAVTALKATLDAFPRLSDYGADVGFATGIKEDAIFYRRYARALPLCQMTDGDDVRDWRIRKEAKTVLTPHNFDNGSPSEYEGSAQNDLWQQRTTLRNRGIFGTTFENSGLRWWQFFHFKPNRLGASQQRVVNAEISTNAHFVYDRSDNLFGGTAPVMTLPDANEAQYRGVAAVLNSSTLEFWFKQVCFDKGNGGIGGGIAAEDWEKFYVRNGTNVLQAPLPISTHSNADQRSVLSSILLFFSNTMKSLERFNPRSLFVEGDRISLSGMLEDGERQTMSHRENLVALQEDLDWYIYGAFGLTDTLPLASLAEIPSTRRGHRPFEIALARRIASGEEESAWFKRHNLEGDQTTEIPLQYTGAFRDIMERRLALIETNPAIAILEQPTFKRRWNFEPWDEMVRWAATTVVLDAISSIFQSQPRLLSRDDVVASLREDPKVMAVVAFAKTDADVDVADTIVRLLTHESLPDNPARILTPSGLAKLVGTQTADTGSAGKAPRVEPFVAGEPIDWKRVWRLQEREDAGDTNAVAVPPPFKPIDYAHPNGWRIRGKFNIPNERFIVFDELTPKRYAWGGWTPVERARLSSEAFDIRDREADDASVQPTLEDPRRCGIQFPLWDKLDELRRTNDAGYPDVKMLAELCGRTCPCDVLARWRETIQTRRPRQLATNGKKSDRIAELKTYRERTIDPRHVEAALALLERSGDAGLGLAALEPAFEGDRDAARAAIDQLRSDGRIEAYGKGRGVRYRIARDRLL